MDKTRTHDTRENLPAAQRETTNILSCQCGKRVKQRKMRNKRTYSPISRSECDWSVRTRPDKVKSVTKTVNLTENTNVINNQITVEHQEGGPRIKLTHPLRSALDPRVREPAFAIGSQGQGTIRCLEEMPRDSVKS